MKRCFLPLAIVSLLALGSSLRANSLFSPCVAGTVASYESIRGGCTVGLLVFSDFSFSNSGNAAALASDSDITLTPLAFGFSVTQTSTTDPAPPLQVGINESATYNIGWHYFVDPGPRAGGADIQMDPPFGDSTITQYFCNESRLSQDGPTATPSCLLGELTNSPVSLQVHNPSPLTASVTFTPPAAFGDVLTQIQLNGSSTQGAGFDALVSTQRIVDDIPEPFTSALGLVGLLGIAFLRRKT
jgi:hypothetical protein